MKRFLLILTLVFSFLFVSFAEPTMQDLQDQLNNIENGIGLLYWTQYDLFDFVEMQTLTILDAINNLNVGGTGCDLSQVESYLYTLMSDYQNWIETIQPRILAMSDDLSTVKSLLYNQATWNSNLYSLLSNHVSSMSSYFFGVSHEVVVISQNVQSIYDSIQLNFMEITTLLGSIDDNLEYLPSILTTLEGIDSELTSFFSDFDSFADDFSLKMDVFEAIFLRLETLLEDIKDDVVIWGSHIHSVLTDILSKDVSIEELLNFLLTITTQSNTYLAELNPLLSAIKTAIEGITVTLEGDIDFPDYSDKLDSLLDMLAFIKNTQQFITDYLSSIDSALASFFSKYDINQTELNAHFQALKVDVGKILAQDMQIRIASQQTSRYISDLKTAFDDYVTSGEEYKEKVEGLIDSEERVSPGELTSDVFDEYEAEEGEINEDAYDPTPELVDITYGVEEEIDGVAEELADFQESVSDLVTSTMDKVKFEVGTFSSSFKYSMDFPLDSGGTYEAVFEVDFADEPYSGIGNSARAIGVFIWTAVTAVYAYRSSMRHLLAIVSN